MSSICKHIFFSAVDDCARMSRRVWRNSTGNAIIKNEFNMHKSIGRSEAPAIPQCLAGVEASTTSFHLSTANSVS